ncbi:helix-turn-helix transcriptional regulator [Limosilactobacillus fermentum]|uniref:helix-turn-helix transcriptional regulator n=1 Tax=Limosilactobacillus fermentum TaxID=1613 RepID=UPI00249A176D|nr:helix-turn-helix transcriptional regulator [Limosilactobacillus fermentum]WGW22199.1 helix-turn-helix transcriptional regulator [Limosilactobacillus fermentum]
MQNLIKECRKAVGMSQKELSNIVGLSCSAIGHYELDVREPNLKTWERIAKALHVSPAYLVWWSDAK